MQNRIFVLLAVSGLIAATGQGGVVINEFSYDDAGGDTSEFVELYNNGASPVDISAWKVTRGSTANTASYTAPGVAASNTTVIPAGGFFLVGTNAGASVGVQNLWDGTIPSNLGNSEQFLAIYDGANAVVDSVIYSRGSGATILTGIGEPPSTGVANTGGGVWAYHVTYDTGTANAGIRSSGDPNASLTLQRNPDPLFNDTGDNERDFLMGKATPKFANFSSGTVTLASVNAGLTFDFDDDVDGKAVTTLPGNYSSMTRQDPTVSDATSLTLGALTSPNPSVIPAAPAPGGGLAGMMWGLTDTAASGFGDASILNLTQPITDVEAEALVYIPAVLTSPYSEMGNFFVLRGRPDVFGQYDGSPGPFANADVGIRLHYENNVAPGLVTLSIDQKVEGTTTTLSGPIPISTPGWYRVLLSVKSSAVAAIIGGTFGTQTPDGSITGQGQRFPASGLYSTTLTRPGGVGMNVHHNGMASLTPAQVVSRGYRPLTFDHLVFRAPSLITILPTAAKGWEILE